MAKYFYVTKECKVSKMIKIKKPILNWHTTHFKHFQLEKLWVDIVTALQARYSGVYDTDFLGNMAPLLVATMLHPRRQIKNQAMILWNATFAHGPPLKYPDSLK